MKKQTEKRAAELVPQIAYFFIDADNREPAEGYIRSVYRDAFRSFGIRHALVAVHFDGGGETGKVTIETSVANSIQIGMATYNAAARLIRQGHKYPIGYVPHEGDPVFLPHEYEKRQKAG